jgi:hypothetical protein
MAVVQKDAPMPYWITRQPPIFAYMSSGERLFASGAELLAFFQSFPPEVQKRGLWITRAGVAELETEEGRARLARLAEQAREQRVLMYDCTPVESSHAWLAAWQCRQRSPVESTVLLRCIPREKPHQDHPWWDC